jgi:hypothetical protein
VSLRRRNNPQPTRTPLLVVCEGDLDASYFTALKRHPNVRNKFALFVRCAFGGGHTKVVEKALKLRKKDIDTWCIFDVENNPECPKLNASVSRCRENSIFVGISNPSFDAWALAHLQKVTGRATPDELKRALKAALEGKLDVRNTHWVLENIMGGDEFPFLQSACGNIACFTSCQTDAILAKNPSTSVSELVQMLIEPKRSSQ